MEKVNKKFWLLVKEVFDKIVSFISFVVLLPLFLVVAILIKLDSPGPVFFLQDRVGKDGKIFKLIKFRSMTDKPRVPSSEVFLDNPEITKVGRFMRRFQIDEIPQLINVLRGEMSLVGPRPVLPFQVEKYNDFQKKRLLMKPGMTGWAAVNGNKYMTWEERIKYDVYYVENWSLWLDFKIIFRTILVVIFGEEVFAKEREEK
jgi:lipopolysaccharide/colanic/teichoic acid biosynthesis glycosyltransferase